MTAPVIQQRAPKLCSINRGIGLWLARQWVLRPRECQLLLDCWAHPTLSPQRRDSLFAAYRQAVAKADALRAGVAWWTEVYPDMRGNGDRQDQAIEYAGDEADELLFVLVFGEGET